MGVFCFGFFFVIFFVLKSIVFFDCSEAYAWHVLLLNYILLCDLQYMQSDPGNKWSFKIIMCSSSLLIFGFCWNVSMGCFHSLKFLLVKIKKLFFTFKSGPVDKILPSGCQLFQTLKIPEQIELQIFLWLFIF